MVAFFSCPSRKSHTLVFDFPNMKNLVIVKMVDKISGSYHEFKFQSFDTLEGKAKVLKSILQSLDRNLESECIFQIENFKEHEIQELNIF